MDDKDKKLTDAEPAEDVKASGATDTPATDTPAKKSWLAGSMPKKNALLAFCAVAVAGIGIGYAGYASMNNQIVVSGGGLSITKAAMTNQLTSQASSAIFAVTVDDAMQKLYPQKVLSDDTTAKKEANKLIADYIKNNGGEKALTASLKQQGTTLSKWKDQMETQAIAQVKSQAKAKQALAIVKDAGMVKKDSITSAMNDYKLYMADAYIAKNDDDANKIANALKNDKTPDKALYQQHQDGLKISSIDNNQDSADVLSKLKDSKKNDVVTVKLATGNGVYVFKIKDSYTYADYKSNNDKAGMDKIKDAVETSLSQQAASSSATLGEAQSKIFKSKHIRFKDNDLNKQFYDALTSQGGNSAMQGQAPQQTQTQGQGAK